MDDGPAKKLISLGADITGSLAGAGIGLAVAGPPGALAGAVAGPVATTAIETSVDFLERQLSKREQEKIGAGLYYALDKINRRLIRGEPPREDDFFTEKTRERAKAKELLEGVLIGCKNQYQEKKIRHLGYIFGNAVFCTYPPEDFNTVLSICERMTYRQMCLLTLASNIKNKRLYKDYSECDMANCMDRMFLGFVSKKMGKNATRIESEKHKQTLELARETARTFEEYPDGKLYEKTGNLMLQNELFELEESPMFLIIHGTVITYRGLICAELMSLDEIEEVDLVAIRKELMTLMSDELKKGVMETLEYNQMLHKLGVMQG